MTNHAPHIVTRFPPSPTGAMHIGNVRTLLFNYLFARKHGGRIVMRFEDTDRERSSREHEQTALDTLAALGLTFDEGPYRQSERTERYTAALEALFEKGRAYEAEESEHGEGERVVRFRNPNTRIVFNDLVRGETTIDTTDFGDFVIARSRANPLYHLSVVVDDLEMGITHVIRGEDHVTSTPRQVLLIEALGETPPAYAHLPLIVGPDKKKLGKRHGAVTYQEFASMGYLPEAIVNYLALLGWNPGDEREYFTLDELIATFSFERVHRAPATFSYDKLASMNQHYMRNLPTSDYLERVLDFLPDSPLRTKLNQEREAATLFVDLVLRERLDHFGEVAAAHFNEEFMWLTARPEYEGSKLLWKETSPEMTRTHLAHIREALEQFTHDQWEAELIKGALWEYASEKGRGEVLWPLRYALTGRDKSPDPFTVAAVLGKDETCERIAHARTLL